MKRFGIAVALALAAGAARGQAAAGDGVAVRQTVDAYLHGLKFNDVESLKKAFHPEAKLFFVRNDGSLGQLTQEKWYEGFKKNAGREEAGELGVVALDITGDAASVKVEELYPKERYVDYLSLLRLRGEWKIVNKIYVMEKR